MLRQNDFEFFIDGKPLVKSEKFELTLSKNQKRKLRLEVAKMKRAEFNAKGCLDIEFPTYKVVKL